MDIARYEEKRSGWTALGCIDPNDDDDDDDDNNNNNNNNNKD